MRNNQGFSLLEVLIALAILSIGLFGFVEAQLIALQQDQAAYLQSVALAQLRNMAELIHACGADGKNAAVCLNQEINRWQKENKRLFPQADSKVVAKGSSYQLTIQWQTPIRSAKESTHTFSLSQEVVP